MACGWKTIAPTLPLCPKGKISQNYTRYLVQYIFQINSKNKIEQTCDYFLILDFLQLFLICQVKLEK